MPIIDAQVHIYERDCAEFPWAPTAGVVAEHARKAGVPMAPSVTGDALIAMMDKAGVDGAVLVSYGALYEFDNRYALSVAAAHPERFCVVGRIDLAAPGWAADLDAFAAKPGAAGVRILGHMQYQEAFRSGAFEPLISAIEAKGLVMCVYAPESVRAIHRIAEAHPSLQIVLDHMCLEQSPPYTLKDDHFAALDDILQLAEHPNVAGKLTGMATLSKTPYPFDDVWPAIHRILDAFGPNRLMWGTDTTRTRLSYDEELNFLRQSEELSQADKALILGESLQRVFRWRRLAR